MLERDGLVRRTPHPRDRRATLVALTEQGSVAARALEEARRELAGFLFHRLTGAEIDGFGATLDRLIARLGEPEFGQLRRAALERWRSLP